MRVHSDSPSMRLTIDSLEVAYSDYVALRCRHLQLEGNVLAIIGHNGAGKSTFIKTTLGLLPPLHGKLTVTRHEGTRDTILNAESHMAFCPETGSVFADISVESYVKLWCRMKHGDAQFYKKEGAKYIDMLHLAPLLPKLGRELSKGQRRRVQTAIGFLTKPKLFLFDEPFDGLDVQKTSELAEIIKQHGSEMSFVVSSHRMDVVERLADVLIVLKDGEFISYGPLEKVCQDLCRQGVTISNISDNDKMVEALRENFRTSLINRMGEKIFICGNDFNFEQLSALAKEVDRNGIRLENTLPSLVDAMNYHLKSIN